MLCSTPMTIPISKDQDVDGPVSRENKKKKRDQQRSARRMAERLLVNTSIIRDSTGPSIANQPITTTGWMGVDAHHRDVNAFEKAWEQGQELYDYLKDFHPIPFNWIEE
jgi:hypothetical protein